MDLLANSSAEYTPAAVGVAVIILLQLSQFFFAWRKDSRSQENAKKEDLKSLRSELMEEIGEVERKLDRDRKAGDAIHADLHEKINRVALDTAKLLKGQEVSEQHMASVSHKLDNLVQRPRPR